MSAALDRSACACAECGVLGGADGLGEAGADHCVGQDRLGRDRAVRAQAAAVRRGVDVRLHNAIRTSHTTKETHGRADTPFYQYDPKGEKH